MTSSGTSGGSTTLPSGIAIAAPVMVAWQQEDLRLFPVTYATSVAEQMNVPFGTDAALPGASNSLTRETSEAQFDVDRQGQGLTVGVKAGIAAGAVGLVLISVAICLFFFIRRPKQRSARSNHSDLSDIQELRADIDSNDKWLIKGQWRTEVEVAEKYRELAERPTSAVELPAVRSPKPWEKIAPQLQEKTPERKTQKTLNATSDLPPWPKIFDTTRKRPQST
ncbi:hypothetical protein M011DRAFT_191508 [Sporormia fimetaria CBS 119925]|uniref:Uncharacterized protein n=1 Tax=Sporormia fimetaria CBS 119925 TaxID=1340428 RepID=A0A6A6VMM1_9PLEO|nr:hypothetical protein M011DRAFT_191508 [Sporormia fimetaria CBS 119925]